ncbi:hypothetical protein E4U42_003297 [Claviceps africana]|uniref:Uncharacterized protein n=1 Tax=Claviceps africana TaxID=83212 RepID=A0A8K0NGX9_9HYPO|nr:hypothetical protein E4U42_003297 [Claviceps africana]
MAWSREGEEGKESKARWFEIHKMVKMAEVVVDVDRRHRGIGHDRDRPVIRLASRSRSRSRLHFHARFTLFIVLPSLRGEVPGPARVIAASLYRSLLNHANTAQHRPAPPSTAQHRPAQLSSAPLSTARTSVVRPLRPAHQFRFTSPDQSSSVQLSPARRAAEDGDGASDN